MADKIAGGVKAGSTSVSLPLELRTASNSIETTGKVYTDVTGSYWRQGSTRTAITMATLANAGSAYSSGGFVEVDGTNMPGVYRFDVPDAAFATGADWVVVSVKVSGCFVQTFMFALETVGAAELSARIPAALSSGNMKCDVLALSGDTTAADNAESFFDGTGYAGTNNVIPTVTTTTNVTTVNGLAANVITATAIAADAIGASELAADAATEIGTAVWAATTRVLTANTNLNDLSAAGIRTAMGLASANLDTQLDALPTNAELATALGTADDAVLAAIAALNNLSQANIRAAIGLASANLDTQLDALPTNAELATALGTADDAVLAAIAALNNLSQANIRTAVGLASANLDTQLSTIDDFLDTEVAAIKAKTDLLNADVATLATRLLTAIELDGSVYRYTTNALEQAPSGGGGGGSTAAQILAYDGSGVSAPDKCLLSLQRLMLNKKVQRVDGTDVYMDVYMEDNTTVAFSIRLVTGSPATPVVGTDSSS